MNLFRNFFDDHSDSKKCSGIPLITEDQLEQIILESKEQLVYVFKNSTRCGFSQIVLRKFDDRISEGKHTYFLLDVIKFRSLSDLIVDKFKVRHESPQLLIFKNGKIIKHDSHSGVLDLI